LVLGIFAFLANIGTVNGVLNAGRARAAFLT